MPGDHKLVVLVCVGFGAPWDLQAMREWHGMQTCWALVVGRWAVPAAGAHALAKKTCIYTLIYMYMYIMICSHVLVGELGSVLLPDHAFVFRVSSR